MEGSLRSMLLFTPLEMPPTPIGGIVLIGWLTPLSSKTPVSNGVYLIVSPAFLAFLHEP